jgi:OOP family OmpA-OmpF porin
MTKRFNPPSPHRIGAVAIAAALAAFAGVVAAQSRAQPTHPGFVVDSGGNVVRGGFSECVRPGQAAAASSMPCPAGATTVRTASATGAAAPRAAAQPAATGASASGAPSRLPGYAMASDGQLVRNGFGECVRAGHWVAANAAEPCDRIAVAQAAPVAVAGSTASARLAAAGAGGTTMKASPGYVENVQDKSVVLSGFNTCVRSGFWSPGMAAEPCDRIAVAQVEPPPAPVAAAPEPKLEPAPAPQALAQPAPAPEPPRPVIQKLTLSTDVLFDFNSAELKEGGKQRLDQLAGQIKDADVDEIIAVGHADRIASDDYNRKLSEARAQAVKDYLQGKVANARTVTAEGKGEAQPVTGDDCKKMGPERASNKKLVACLQPDRRVEIEVLGSRQVAGGAPAAGAGTTGGSSAPAGGGATTR